MRIKKYGLLVGLGIVGLSFSFLGFAAECGRNDIDHYLASGFSPSQVVQLCAQKNPVKDDPVDENVSYLQSSIAAIEIEFFDNEFFYVAKECITFDPTPIGIKSNVQEFCGYIKTTVQYSGLVIPDLGPLEIKIFSLPFVAAEGVFEKTIVDLKKVNVLSKHERKLLLRYMRGLKNLNIPIFRDVVKDKVKVALRKLAA